MQREIWDKKMFHTILIFYIQTLKLSSKFVADVGVGWCFVLLVWVFCLFWLEVLVVVVFYV